MKTYLIILLTLLSLNVRGQLNYGAEPTGSSSLLAKQRTGYMFLTYLGIPLAPTPYHNTDSTGSIYYDTVLHQFMLNDGTGYAPITGGGGGSGTVTSISSAHGIILSPSTITTSGSVKVDTATLYPEIRATIPTGQPQLNGTGFVKASGTTISYDNTAYYPNSNPNGYTSNTGTVTNVIAGTNISITGTSTIQPTVNISGTIGMSNGGTGATTTTSLNTTPITYGINNTITSAPSGSAGGDLTGSYPNPTIVTVNATPATYTNATVVVNSKGQVTSATSGTAPVTSVSGTAGNITSSGGVTPVINLATAGTAGTNGTSTQIPVFVTDAFGRVTSNTNTAIGTLNQNTTGSAATLTTPRNIFGQSFNGSANVAGSMTATSTILNGSTSGSVTELPPSTVVSYTWQPPSAVATSTGMVLSVASITSGTMTTAWTNSGTVTSFSAGTLPPLFTTSVGTATTTPALSFSLSNTTAHTFFGNFTGSSTTPSFGNPVLASADFANQGTTTTVLHGNAAGNPSFGSVVTGDIAANAVTLAKMDASTATARKAMLSQPSASPIWSTETYAVPSTSGNVMTSDGTNWTSAPPVATPSNTITFTNKRNTARVTSTTTVTATPTINTDNQDIWKVTAQAVDITSMTTNLSGTPVDGDIFEVQITGTAARAITWGTSFVSSSITLPTTTVTTATLTVIFQYYTVTSYGNNKWVCVNFF